MHPPDRCPNCMSEKKCSQTFRLTKFDSIIEVTYLCGAVLSIDLEAKELEWIDPCRYKAKIGARVQ